MKEGARDGSVVKSMSQRTGVRFPEPISVSSQPSVTPALGREGRDSDALGQQHTYTDTYIHD